MATPSKRVSNCEKTGRYVQASLEANAEKAAAEASKSFGGKLGEAALKALFAALLWLIVDRTERLAAAELEYVREQGEDVEARDRREQSTLDLSQGLQRVRHRLDSLGGETLVAQCHLSGSLPTSPQQLLTLTRNVCQALRSFQGPIEDELGGSLYDPAPSADFLERHASALEKSLDAVDLDKRETQDTLIERDAALTRWKLAYRCVSAITEGLYRLAGMERAAEQIRYRARRQRGEEAPSPEPTPENPTG